MGGTIWIFKPDFHSSLTALLYWGSDLLDETFQGFGRLFLTRRFNWNGRIQWRMFVKFHRGFNGGFMGFNEILMGFHHEQWGFEHLKNHGFCTQIWGCSQSNSGRLENTMTSSWDVFGLSYFAIFKR